jgi:hypothetical protein
MRNMKRKDVLILVEWCENKFGKSKFQKTFPKVVVNNKKGPYCGVYFYNENEIHIFPKQCKTFLSLCDTVIHEYTHYLQKMDMYDVYYSKYNRNYDNHPYEVSANNKGAKYRSELKKHFNAIKKTI